MPQELLIEKLWKDVFLQLAFLGSEWHFNLRADSSPERRHIACLIVDRLLNQRLLGIHRLYQSLGDHGLERLKATRQTTLDNCLVLGCKRLLMHHQKLKQLEFELIDRS